jgi:hypothetical protein
MRASTGDVATSAIQLKCEVALVIVRKHSGKQQSPTAIFNLALQIYIKIGRPVPRW